MLRFLVRVMVRSFVCTGIILSIILVIILSIILVIILSIIPVIILVIIEYSISILVPAAVRLPQCRRRTAVLRHHHHQAQHLFLGEALPAMLHFFIVTQLPVAFLAREHRKAAAAMQENLFSQSVQLLHFRRGFVHRKLRCLSHHVLHVIVGE
jgi:hypothetical protein